MILYTITKGIPEHELIKQIEVLGQLEPRHEFSIKFVTSASMVSNKKIPTARSSPLLGSSLPLLRHTWREHPQPRETEKIEAVESWSHQLFGGFSMGFPWFSNLPTIWWTKDLSKALDELMSTKSGLTGGGASSSRPGMWPFVG